MLKSAAMPDKTVIITTLNQAWAANNTMIDLFLDSFHRGEDIEKLLQHLVVVALDQKSYDRCQQMHHHCYMLVTAGVDFSGFKPYMSDDFLKMMWRRMEFMKEILEIGYNFVFSVSFQDCIKIPQQRMNSSLENLCFIFLDVYGLPSVSK